jgi:hypothetical protein
MPLNPFDGTYRSFANQVVPELHRRGIAVLGMKPLSGAGPAIKAGVLTAEESLRYAMSLPVTTTITGMEKMDVVEQNLKIAQNFQPMTESEMSALRDRVAQYAADGRYEPYKVSLKYDNPEARLAHSFPLDMQQKEVKEMVRATDNTGKPFPPAK